MRFISKILVSASLAATFAYAQTLPKFQHIIVVVQENRTPDNLFGSNPTFETGVDLQTPSAGPWCLGACFDPGHRHSDWESQYQQPKQACPGTMGKGLCTAQATCNGQTGQQMPVPSCPQQTYVSGTYDNSVVAPYFDIAEKYGFANYMFQTNEGPSMPAHQFLFSGTSAPNGVVNQQYFNYFLAENPGNVSNTGCTVTNQQVELIDSSGSEDASVSPCFDHNSLPTLLDQNHISWTYYGNQRSGGISGPTGIWTAPNAIKEMCYPLSGGQCNGTDWVNNVRFGTSQILRDLGAGTPEECGLRNVSWVIPNYDRSDHPGFVGSQNNSTEIEGGPSWVADIINAVGQNPCKNGDGSNYWNTTAIFVTWDDWGGFWDHINPSKAAGGPGVLINTTQTPCSSFGCGYIYGFRVPLLVVSAYTPAHYVSGSPSQGGETFPFLHDFGSILAFIENNFGVNQVGGINPPYPFADVNAPDNARGNIPLSDFFPIPQNQPRQFQGITLSSGAPNINYFINYSGPVEDPDNDAVDND
jgi:phospholipase C